MLQAIIPVLVLLFLWLNAPLVDAVALECERWMALCRALPR